MSDVSSLIARLEKAVGPNYSLEVEIAYLTGFWPAERIDRVTRSDDGYVLVWFTEGPDLPLPPSVLSSIDAAVSLAERVLPGARWELTTTGFKPGASLVTDCGIFGGYAATPALAICLSTLRALQQKGSSNE